MAYIDEEETEAGIGMSEDDLQNRVRQYVSDAIQYIDDEISPLRAESTKYYLGDEFGNEVEGRSQVVSRDVRDSVQSVLPSLMRVFFGTEKVVEFVPRGPEDIAQAEQATDYVNYILKQDNDAVAIFYSVFKDALMNKSGIVKWWWDDSIQVSTHNFEALPEAAMGLLLEEEGVEAVSVESYPDPNLPQEQVETMEIQGMDIPQLYDIEIRRKKPINKVRVATMPPEEFFVDAAATSMTNAQVVGHRTMATISDLVAMGYEEDEVSQYASDQVEFLDNENYIARHPDSSGAIDFGQNQRRVQYVEAWCKIDYDGDGIAELRKICTLGENFHVVNNEPTSDIPFSIFACDPEPHLFFGSDLADLTKDIQRIKSAVIRGMLDSLAFALYPRTGIVEGMVDIDDVLNPEVGSVIRMRQPGMVQQLNVPFLGKEAFPMIQYLDQMKTERTGQSAASQGLDPDVLQSTTRAGVMATIKGAEQHTEMIARLFAEMGFKPLFRGLLRLVIKHQDQERMVRLRNQWVPVDPRVWDATMDVSVNVGMGAGQVDEKMAMLTQVAARQEQMMDKLGLDNPLVSLGQYRTTLSKMLEVAGWEDANQFFKPLAPDWSPPPPPPPPPTPEQEMLQVQMQDIQAKQQIEQEKVMQSAQREQAIDERERTRIAGDQALREFDLEQKYASKVDLELLRATLAEQESSRREE